jgi:hypothetical protein
MCLDTERIMLVKMGAVRAYWQVQAQLLIDDEEMEVLFGYISTTESMDVEADDSDAEEKP